MDEATNEASGETPREVPIDWEALENAFENNAPEVHSYLQVDTGDVLRVVDGVADPQMHARIASDVKYLRIEAVSSREQYRWMELYIPTVEEPKLKARLEVAIDGKGAFRRFKDVLMTHATERERWFSYRSERLKTFMEAWLKCHSVRAVSRVLWAVPKEGDETLSEDERRQSGVESSEYRRLRSTESLRKRLRDLADLLGPRDVDSVVAFGEFLRSRRNAKSFAYHHAASTSRRDETNGDSADNLTCTNGGALSTDQEVIDNTDPTA